MEFLGVGYQELLLILVLMLVVVGPERLPGVAYQIGRAVKTMQQYARAVRTEFSEEISYIEEQYKTVRGEVDSTRETLRERQVAFEAEMREATADVQSAVAVPALAAPSQEPDQPAAASPGTPPESTSVSDDHAPPPAGTPAPPLVF